MTISDSELYKLAMGVAADTRATLEEQVKQVGEELSKKIVTLK